MRLYRFSFVFISMWILGVITPAHASPKGKVYIESAKDIKVYTGKLLSSEESGVDGFDNVYLEFETPASLQGIQILVLFDQEKSANLSKFVKSGEHIAFRLHNRVMNEIPELIYDVEIVDGFPMKIIPEEFTAPSSLDKYPNIPSKKKPKFPKDLPSDFKAVNSKYIVFVDETGKAKKVIRIYKGDSIFNKLTLKYINDTTFSVGKLDGKPVPYFQIVSLNYIVDGYRPYY
ncbi:MAG: hypothetical protein MI748_04070 [Opitutales bacterium]|nr:hypothetical protein [Opitutales bacterium]